MDNLNSLSNSPLFDGSMSSQSSARERVVRGTLIVLGTFFAGLGLIGVFLPLLPTTPFLLLAAACYAKGSRKCHTWFLNNRWFGKYVAGYLKRRGLPQRTKVLLIFLLWLTIGYSTVFLVPQIALKLVMIAVATGVSWHILTLKTLQSNPKSLSGT